MAESVQDRIWMGPELQHKRSMPKNKHLKFQRVKDLPNVTITGWTPCPAHEEYPWDHTRYFGMKRWLELGCGKGEHSLAFAAANPGTLCVGVDRKSHRICVGAETAIAMGLENLHFLRAHIERLESFFAKHSIDEIWLTFPDPHPKHRMSHRRLTAPSFLDVYAKLLIPGGKVNLKTDSDLLVDYTCEAVRQWGGQVVAMADDRDAAGCAPIAAPGVVSAFEHIARAKGRTIKYVTFGLE